MVALEFRLPDIGEGLSEAEVVRWLVEPGQHVDLDAPMVEIETDKALTEIPAPRAGVLLHQGAGPGSTVRVGEVLAVIGEPGEAWATTREAAPIVGTLVEAVEDGDAGRGDAVQALPMVRKLARELGIELASLQGTGPRGRVTREDVEAAARAGGAAGGAAEGATGQRVRMTPLRRTIARRMARSWREIPHVTTFGEADATTLVELRRTLAARRGRPMPFEALFIGAVLPALRAFPEFNASVDGEDVVLARRHDIGVAVDTPDGLVVAVVKEADRLELDELADEVIRLGASTRSRRVSVADLSGGTFTVSNIGAVGGGHGTPIVPLGTTAILSFGRIEDRPVARAGRVEVAPLLPLSLSYDHRVIDGALGRKFLAMVVRNLEDPRRFVAIPS